MNKLTKKLLTRYLTGKYNTKNAHTLNFKTKITPQKDSKS